MFKKMINPLMVAVIAMLPMTVAHASETSSKSKTAASAKTADFDYKLKPKQVSKNVWCFFGALEMPTKENGGNMVNTCYIKTNDSYVLWDTGASYVYAKQAYKAMSKVAGKLPVKAIILSHEHDDHWLGNNYYKETFGAKIVGPESVNKNYKPGDKTRMFQTLTENAIRGTKIIPVDEWHKEVIKFTISGVNFEYVPVGNGHSEEDYFLYMPDNKVILAGDLVMNGRITSNRDGSVIGQLAALERINSKDWTTLVPGHGFIIDKTATDESVQYFTLTKERVQAAMENGVDSTGIVEAVPLEEFKNKGLYEALHGINISRAYQEFDMGL
ncbi:MAG: MBL fold metallo-hydrolase [Sulfurimonas sp. RIFCSPLOWO2_12_FULL_36_74]|uniref:MBL fold metallo-hydrolase n=1 Tax=Sulfurimonas sp. RIFCSPLOWO2_12_36_12 TaxID=1802253 RepID=UPI0008C461B6|nr:MBL fold metallo-hydrolase [Sulfurimonas sp. RIFCSPLOWO2_12_36_12]OHE00601.1 MAG: MBL fold metallo-hydrolase [Sulfurimonas sp. RIFCSPLOWO2_12_36_12]OHE05624.1 MAG: MBL fold metallo-hydrolase [Sulfurimonas sp. RIFCSPLOWO2_12_FULL_36_74]